MFDDYTDFIESWLIGEHLPKSLASAVADPECIFHAYNAQFELAIWKHVMCVRHGWPEPPPLERWRDTMAEVAIAGYPMALDKVSAILGDELKDPQGKKLIKTFSIPNKNGRFVEPEDQPEEFKEFIRYCKQDVLAERAIHKRLYFVKSAEEQKVWEMVVRMNQRGLPIDDELVSTVTHQLAVNSIYLQAKITTLTEGRVTKPTQVARILAELKRHGVDLPNLTAETLNDLDDLSAFPPEAAELLSFRKLGGKSSTAKFRRILELLCYDGTVKDNLRYYGAGSGRMSGAGFQPQNLPRYKHKDPEPVIEAFRTADPSILRLMFNVEEAASGLIRPSILAPPSKYICANDFSGVEACGVCWLCGEQDLIAKIKAGLDMYKVQASQMFNVGYDAVSPLQRQVGKILVLACGFAGGYVVFVNQAKLYKLPVTESEAKTYVRMFRQSRPRLTTAWKEFENASLLAMTNQGDIFQAGSMPIAFQKIRGFLKMTLPSGRSIYYPEVELKNGLSRFDGRTVTEIHSGWVNSQTHQWGTRTLSGPLLFQNAIQGLCRDLLIEAQIRLESAGYVQIGSVHDEAITLLDEAQKDSLEDIQRIMNELPGWAKGFPLKSSGYVGRRYKKD
jgi:DNA polymerase